MNRIVRLILISCFISTRLFSQDFIEVPLFTPPIDSISEVREWEFSQDDLWKFRPNADSNSHMWNWDMTMNLDMFNSPSEWQMAGRKVLPGNQAGYYKNLEVPADWRGNVIKLRFNGVYSHGTAYVNGNEIGEIKHPFTSYEFEISPYLIYGRHNMLHVKVDNKSLGDSLSNAAYESGHNLGGVNRSATMFALPECYFTSVQVRTRFDSAYDNAWMIVDYSLANSLDTVRNIGIDFRMVDTSGTMVYLGSAFDRTFELHAKESRVLQDSFLIDSPVKWDPEHPVLYELNIRLWIHGDWRMWSTRKFGFRQIEVRGNQVYVNNKPIKLRGINRHDIDPYRGRVIRPVPLKHELLIYRQANINYIRTSHYPPNDEFLDLCDELGFFTEVEAPFSRAHVSMADGQSEYLLPESRRREAIIDPTLRMVSNYRSHPSILMWSLGNESKNYEEYFRESARAVKELDPYRPLVFSQFTPDADMNELEIGNHHFPGSDGPSLYGNTDRPIVFDAYSHLLTYNHRQLITDPGVREKWVEQTAGMWEEMYRTKGILGGAVWAGIDDMHIIHGNPYGSGSWGIMDTWRRTKPEYWNLYKIYSPVRIQKNPGQKNKRGTLCLKIENRHDFTNLNECLIQWSCGGQAGEIEVDIPPRSSGDVTFLLPDNPDTSFIDIAVRDPRGVTVQYSRIDLGFSPEKTGRKNKVSLAPLSYVETDTALIIQLEGSSVRVNKLNGKFSFSDERVTLLYQSPELMIIPFIEDKEFKQYKGTNKEPEPFFQCASNWKTSKVEIISRKKKECTIQISGEYKEASGSYAYKIERDGKTTIFYNFEIKEELTPWQMGLVFEVNDSLSTLKWEKESIWSFYPSTHIERPIGEAKTDMTVPVSRLPGPVNPPSNIWEKDRNIYGSNDFRAIRSGIHHAALQSQTGNAIEVYSDGKQAVRAWHENQSVNLLIADFVSNNLKPVVWKKGKQISGTVRLGFKQGN